MLMTQIFYLLNIIKEINLISANNNFDDLENTIKNSIYLKNIYNILFYDSKTQVDFRNSFYEKSFQVNASINDFIEMNFKISLEYENISERNYVKTIYEILDENDNSLFIKSINKNEYSYFSNRIFVNENIFIILQKMLKI